MAAKLGKLILDLIDHEDVPIGAFKEGDGVGEIAGSVEWDDNPPMVVMTHVSGIYVTAHHELIDKARGKADADQRVAEDLAEFLTINLKDGATFWMI